MVKKNFHLFFWGMIVILAIFLAKSTGLNEKIVSTLPGEGMLGGLNVPDTCQLFTQIASRGSKGRIKAAPGKLFSFSVTSSASQGTYFQIYDRANLTVRGQNFATPSFSIPVPARTAVEVPARVDYDFVAPMSLPSSGMYFALSNTFANYSSAGFVLKANDFVVEACYQ